MNSYETIQAIRLMLDDQTDWFMPRIVEWVNEAQNSLITEFYKAGNEQALRPLYVRVEEAQYSQSFTDCLYPRACRVKYYSMHSASSKQASYVEYDKFINHAGKYNLKAPRTVEYTFINNMLFFSITHPENLSTALAEFWYIKKPTPFSFDPNQLNVIEKNVPLSLPREYHIDVCTMAAKIINDIDVGETERGQLLNPNMRIDFTDVNMR